VHASPRSQRAGALLRSALLLAVAVATGSSDTASASNVPASLLLSAAQATLPPLLLSPPPPPPPPRQLRPPAWWFTLLDDEAPHEPLAPPPPVLPFILPPPLADLPAWMQCNASNTSTSYISPLVATDGGPPIFAPGSGVNTLALRSAFERLAGDMDWRHAAVGVQSSVLFAGLTQEDMDDVLTNVPLVLRSVEAYIWWELLADVMPSHASVTMGTPHHSNRGWRVPYTVAGLSFDAPLGPNNAPEWLDAVLTPLTSGSAAAGLGEQLAPLFCLGDHCANSTGAVFGTAVLKVTLTLTCRDPGDDGEVLPPPDFPAPPPSPPLPFLLPPPFPDLWNNTNSSGGNSTFGNATWCNQTHAHELRHLDPLAGHEAGAAIYVPGAGLHAAALEAALATHVPAAVRHLATVAVNTSVMFSAFTLEAMESVITNDLLVLRALQVVLRGILPPGSVLALGKEGVYSAAGWAVQLLITHAPELTAAPGSGAAQALASILGVLTDPASSELMAPQLQPLFCLGSVCLNVSSAMGFGAPELLLEVPSGCARDAAGAAGVVPPPPTDPPPAGEQEAQEVIPPPHFATRRLSAAAAAEEPTREPPRGWFRFA
jgi:hypothetical protein